MADFDRIQSILREDIEPDDPVDGVFVVGAPLEEASLRSVAKAIQFRYDGMNKVVSRFS